MKKKMINDKKIDKWSKTELEQIESGSEATLISSIDFFEFCIEQPTYLAQLYSEFSPRAQERTDIWKIEAVRS